LVVGATRPPFFTEFVSRRLFPWFSFFLFFSPLSWSSRSPGTAFPSFPPDFCLDTSFFSSSYARFPQTGVKRGLSWAAFCHPGSGPLPNVLSSTPLYSCRAFFFLDFSGIRKRWAVFFFAGFVRPCRPIPLLIVFILLLGRDSRSGSLGPQGSHQGFGYPLSFPYFPVARFCPHFFLPPFPRRPTPLWVPPPFPGFSTQPFPLLLPAAPSSPLSFFFLRTTFFFLFFFLQRSLALNGRFQGGPCSGSNFFSCWTSVSPFFFFFQGSFW